MEIDRNAITEMAISAVLRIYRKEIESGNLVTAKHLRKSDLDELRFVWAVSRNVTELANRLITNPRQIVQSIDYRIELHSGEAVGGIDARETLYQQEITGDISLLVAQNSFQTIVHPANRVIYWIMREAYTIVERIIATRELDSEYKWIHDAANLLVRTLKIDVLKEISTSSDSNRRPDANCLRSARRNRSQLYREAVRTYDILVGIEEMNMDVLSRLLKEALIPSLKTWQIFEIFVGISVLETFGKVVPGELELMNFITGGATFGKVGDFELHWQFTAARRLDSALNEAEMLSRKTLGKLGFRPSGSRCDFVVKRRLDGESKIVSIVECKWFEGSSQVSTAVTDAVEQLVRYGRDIENADMTKVERLVAASVIAIAKRSEANSTGDGNWVCLVDVQDIMKDRLVTWANNLVR